jgi:ribosomal protein S18 acetylase RimI-like enzyme
LLDWDFRAAAELMIRFVRMRTLSGFALVDGHRAVGYCYYVCEDDKGLVGDLYVSRAYLGNGDSEIRLLASALRALAATPLVARIESQFMMLSPNARARMPYPGMMRPFDRLFMLANASSLADLPEGRAAGVVEFSGWHEGELESAARLIARTYTHHIDARINDQYRSVPGARRFIVNILQYPGCGSFFKRGSIVARDRTSGRLLGVCLASLVAYDVGHVTQVCVDPDLQGSGIGYELMRRSVSAMVKANCRRVSLTVTTANVDAVRLYERIGFAAAHRFEAFVWDGVGR